MLQLCEEIHEITSDHEHEAMFFGERFNFFSKSKQVVPDWSLLIDTGSNCSMIKDSNLLTQIRKTAKPLDLITNGCHFDACMKRRFVDKMLVWCSEKLVATFLGFRQLAKHLRTICDTMHEDVACVNSDEDTCLKFVPFGAVLHAFNTHNNTRNNTNKPSFSSCSLVQNFSNDKLKFTPEEAALSEDACKLQNRI